MRTETLELDSSPRPWRRLGCRIRETRPPQPCVRLVFGGAPGARGGKAEGVGGEVTGGHAQRWHNVWQTGSGNVEVSPAAPGVPSAGGENVQSPTGPNWSHKFCRRWGQAHSSGKMSPHSPVRDTKMRVRVCVCVCTHENATVCVRVPMQARVRALVQVHACVCVCLCAYTCVPV